MQQDFFFKTGGDIIETQRTNNFGQTDLQTPKNSVLKFQCSQHVFLKRK